MRKLTFIPILTFFLGYFTLLAGASSGIGAGTAVELAKLGCQLALNGRNHENLEKTAQLCKEQGLIESKV